MKTEPTKQPPQPKVPKISLTLLSSLQEIRHRLELAESGLTSHLHIPLGENSVHECSVNIQKLQVNTFYFFFRLYLPRLSKNATKKSETNANNFQN